MKNNKGITLVSIVIIMLLIIILIALVWLGVMLMSFNDKNKDANPETVINDNNDDENENAWAEIDVGELVYDAEYDKTSDAKTYKIYQYIKNAETQEWEYEYDYDNPISVSLSDVQYPYINIDSVDAQKANNEIKNMYTEYETIYKNMENFCREDGALYVGDINTDMKSGWDSYSVYKYENILSVVIKADKSGLGYFSYSTWVFNLDTKEFMSFEEMCEKLGYNENEIQEEVEKQVYEKLKGYEESLAEVNSDYFWDCSADYEETMDWYSKDKYYYIDDDGTLNMVVLTAIPYEKGICDFVYTIK